MLCLCCLLLLCSLNGAERALAQDNPNLIQNAGFEELTAENLPQGYFVDAFRRQPNASQFKSSEELSYRGKRSIYIKNNSSNDARFAQTVEVEPNTLYKLSGYIQAGGVTEGKGANLSIEGVYSFTDAVYDSEGEWQYVELYGKTGPQQRKLTVFARLGGYSGESKGYAYFDELSLTKVTGDSLVNYDEWFAAPREALQEPAQSRTSHGLFVLLAIVYLLLAYAALKLRHRPLRHGRLLLALGFGLALALRLGIAVLLYGYQVDMGCFIGWANALQAHGIGGFYGSGIFCDYPPGYLWILRLNGLLFARFGTDATLLRLVTKALPILCDLLAAGLLYRLASRRHGQTKALLLSLLYAFNPIAILLSSAWGQIDAVFALLMALAFYLLYTKKEQLAIPLYMLACLIKPQGLIFGPIALAYLLLHRRDIGWKKPLIGLGGALAVLLAVAVPFTPQSAAHALDLHWLVQLYGEVMSSYAYATINTANLFYILGANWLLQNSAIPPLFLGIWAALALLAALLCTRRLKGLRAALKQEDTRRRALLTLLLYAYALGVGVILLRAGSYLDFGNWNTLFAILLCTALLLTMPRERFAYIMAMMIHAVYVLGMRMHERYLFVALLLYFVDYALNKDRNSLLLGLLITPSLFVNTGIVLDNSLVHGSAKGHLNLDSLLLNNALSLYNCAVLLLALWLVYAPAAAERLYRAYDRGAALELKALPQEEIAPLAKIDRKDVWIMLAVSLIYAVFGFYRLGSTLAPQTSYTFSNAGESIVLDLGEERDFNVLYYGGVNYNTLRFSASSDGRSWSQEHPAHLNQSQIFRWKYLSNYTLKDDDEYNFSHEPMILRGRYLRITAEEAGVNLWEVALRSPYVNGQKAELYPIAGIAAHENMDTEFAKPEEARHLFDEQNTVPDEPGLYNSTYFDEIYHARTGYEHLHGLHPYETSHPPLGKLFMTLGIWIFGMTPFGYRFFGALIGVLMLPALYVTAKYLLRSRKYAFAAMFLFAVDMMHLTQTRIATIDSYPVFFIMMSYLFMIKYVLLDHAELPLRRLLWPLFWSGLFFGLSVASKWIGLYAGVGLAILYFTSIASQIRRSGARFSPQNPAVYKAAQTALGCIVFFLLIPALIYYLSYIPYFAPTGGISLERLLSTQQSMLRYHSTPGLGADHPYQSPWWQWPLIGKPMWYALDYYEPQGYNATIFAMGNPSVFYVSFAAMLLTLMAMLGRVVSALRGKKRVISACFCIGIGFLSQYLPWVIVPRSTYIYHYFASIPFIILAGCYVFQTAERLFPARKKGINALLILYLAVSFAMFIAFYPYGTGILTSNAWLDAMKWFKGIWY